MQCYAITKKGERCKNNSLPYKFLCGVHMTNLSSADFNCDLDRPSISDLPENVRTVVSKYCDLLPLENVKYILGPVSYKEYDYMGKTISIFGEVHQIQDPGNCYVDLKHTLPFSSFMWSLLLQNGHKFYDLFLESHYISRERKTRSRIVDTLTSFYLLDRDFKRCLSFDKSQCEYENRRAHYTDIRMFLSDELPLYRELLNALYYGVKDTIPSPAMVEAVYQQTLNCINTNHIITKELSKSGFDVRIKAFVFKKLIKSRDVALKWVNIHPTAHKTVDKIFTLYQYIMDVYMLARVLRPAFAQRESKTSSYKPETMDNIILYVGDDHAAVYDEFFAMELGLLPTVDIDQDPLSVKSSCLDVSEIKSVSKLFQ